MDITIIRPDASHVEAINRICSTGWLQTVEGKYDEKHKRETIEYWYNHQKVLDDIKNGIYTHVALVGGEVVGTIGGVLTDGSAKFMCFMWMPLIVIKESARSYWIHSLWSM